MLWFLMRALLDKVKITIIQTNQLIFIYPTYTPRDTCLTMHANNIDHA